MNYNMISRFSFFGILITWLTALLVVNAASLKNPSVSAAEFNGMVKINDGLFMEPIIEYTKRSSDHREVINYLFLEEDNITWTRNKLIVQTYSNSTQFYNDDSSLLEENSLIKRDCIQDALRCGQTFLQNGIQATQTAGAWTATQLNAAKSAVQTYLSANNYAQANALIQGVTISITTGIAVYYITTRLGGKKGENNECYVVRPVDLTQSATDNIQRVCDAAGAGQAEVQPGKIIVTNRYRDLDGVHFGQELVVKSTLTYDQNGNNGPPCKLAGITL